MRFRIEKLEERIAPAHAAFSSQIQVGQNIGNGNGPHHTDVTFTQVGPGSGSQLQVLSGVGNGNGPHDTDVTLTQIASSCNSCGCS